MDRGLFQLILALAVVWSTAMVVKALRALRTGEPYTFSMWDGGMLRAGKQLSRLGTQIKVVLTLLLAGGCALGIANVIPVETARWVMMGCCGLCLVADFSLTEKPRV